MQRLLFQNVGLLHSCSLTTVSLKALHLSREPWHFCVSCSPVLTTGEHWCRWALQGAQSVCRRGGSSLSFTGCSLLPEQDRKPVLGHCTLRTPEAARFLEGSSSPSPWQRPAESGAQEQEVCLTMFYLCSRQVCPARVGTGQQHSTSEVHRGPASPAPGSAAGGSLLCSAALNLSAKSSYMYFPVICAIHGKVTHCLSDFPADSLHTK